MNSIFFVFEVFSAILAAIAPIYCSNKDRQPQEVILPTPFRFEYPFGAYFNVIVNIKNLSPTVVYKVYEADNSLTKEIKTLKKDAGRDVYVIQKPIMKERIIIFIEIKTKARCCKNKIVFEARALPRLRHKKADPGYEHNDVCLRAAPPCTFAIDLTNECTEPSTCNEQLQTSAKSNTETTSTERETDSGVLRNNTFENIPTTTNRTTPRGNNKRNDQQKPFNLNVLIYVIPFVVGMCIIILVTFKGVKKYCNQNSHPVETMELDTYATANQVVYADLSLVHGKSRPPRRDEESPYAKIMGVMKPVEQIERTKT